MDKEIFGHDRETAREGQIVFLEGAFTEEEMDILKKMYEDGIHLRIIADRLGRKNHRSKPRSNLLRLIFKIATSLCSFTGACQRSGKD